MTDSATNPTPEFLTVPELAALLRIKERKVYDLASSGEVPCSRATGKLLFPEREVRAWIARAGSGWGQPAAQPRPAIFLGSHDPLLEWALRQSRCGLATFFDSSLDGLARFRAREGLAAGLHLWDASRQDWNVPQVAADCAGENAVLIGWATRRRGLVLRPEMAGRIARLGDLGGLTIVPRQEKSGAEVLFRSLLAEAGLGPEAVTRTQPALSETDAVLSVARGDADAAFGLEAVARPFGLDFVALVEERFDLLVDRAAWFEPPLQRLMTFCRGEDFAARAADLSGYSLAGFGDVRWNA